MRLGECWRVDSGRKRKRKATGTEKERKKRRNGCRRRRKRGGRIVGDGMQYNFR